MQLLWKRKEKNCRTRRASLSHRATSWRTILLHIAAAKSAFGAKNRMTDHRRRNSKENEVHLGKGKYTRWCNQAKITMTKWHQKTADGKGQNTDVVTSNSHVGKSQKYWFRQLPPHLALHKHAEEYAGIQLRNFGTLQYICNCAK